MILLEGALDYAGLFPPASLGMAEAVRSWAAYSRSENRSLLGRFVVPVARLAELSRAADAPLLRDPEGVWDVSVIGAGDPREDTQRIADAEARHGGGGPSLSVRSIEQKVESVTEIQDVAGAYHDAGGRTLYLEIDAGARDLDAMVGAVAAAGACAKIRTGGTAATAFPSAAAVARFVCACSDASVAFKATAGLHHALRGEHSMDGAGGPCATMHGFVNLFVGAVLFDARRIDESELGTVLEERSWDAFDLADDSVRWRDRGAGPDEIRRARTRLLHSFGTCSCEDPVRELRGIGAVG